MTGSAARGGPVRHAARTAVLIALACLVAVALRPLAARAATPVDARVQGPFAMVARVTAAVRVRGEHRGQILRRRWEVTPAACDHSLCRRLFLARERAGHRIARIVLHRTGPGRYAGRGLFYVALRCRGRIYPRGSRVPYRITLTVRRSVEVQGVRFARALQATYVNPARSDATPCPLGPSHDAARYTGQAASPSPTPPTAAFTWSAGSTPGAVAFAGASSRGGDGAAIVARTWDFGDPASGAADHSDLSHPTHTYAQPGTYTVTLTVLDADGLRATTTHSVTVPALPPPPAGGS